MATGGQPAVQAGSAQHRLQVGQHVQTAPGRPRHQQVWQEPRIYFWGNESPRKFCESGAKKCVLSPLDNFKITLKSNNWINQNLHNSIL